MDQKSLLKYSYSYFPFSQIKFANVNLLNQLDRFSKPDFRPITTTIETVLNDESIPPRNILPELNRRLFVGPVAVFPRLNDVFQEALQVTRNEKSVAIYQEILKSMKQLQEFILTPVKVIDEMPPVAASMKKKSMIDPVEYAEIRQRLQDSLSTASQIDGAIRFLSSELVSSTQYEHFELPEMPLFREDVSSMEEIIEEEDVEKKTEQLDETILASLSDFLKRIANPIEFQDIVETIVPVLEQEIPKAIKAILDSPEVSPKIKEKLQRSIPNYAKVSNTLSRLKDYAQRGFIARDVGFEKTPRKTTAFELVARRIKKVLEKSEIESLPDGTDFEDILIMNPLLLGQMVGVIHKSEKTNGRSKEISIEDSILEHFKYKAEEAFDLTDVDPEVKEFLHRHEIESRDDFINLAEWFNKTITIPVQNDVMSRPELYDDERIPQLTPDEQRCMSLNRSATKFSMYQLHANQAFITALTKKIRRKEEVESSLVLFKEVLKRCFPESLVDNVRECMAVTFSSDYEMLQHQDIRDPKLKSNVLFMKMPSTYEDTIDEMVKLLSFAEESAFYFPFAGRQVLGRLFSLAYGGGYKSIKGKRSSTLDKYTGVTYPEYADRPVILDSFSDWNAPFWGHKPLEMVKNMRNIEAGTAKAIKNFILHLEESGKLDEDDVLKALFYLSYMIVSSELVKAKKMVSKEEKGKFEQDYSIFDEWMDTYYELVLSDDGSKIASYLHVFSPKFLLKTV